MSLITRGLGGGIITAGLAALGEIVDVVKQALGWMPPPLTFRFSIPIRANTVKRAETKIKIHGLNTGHIIEVLEALEVLDVLDEEDEYDRRLKKVKR